MVELSEIELHHLTFLWRDQRLQHYIKEFYRYYLKFKLSPLPSAKVYNKFSIKKQILNKNDVPICFEAICNIINRAANKIVIMHHQRKIFWL